MKPKACVACAKRKVRCDGEEPCSHCKRRKQDHCFYPKRQTSQLQEPEFSTGNLKGYPKTPESIDRETSVDQELRTPATRVDGGTGQSHAKPLVIATNSNSVYLESPAWENWDGKICEPVRDLQTLDQSKLAQTTPIVPKLIALQSILNPDPSNDFSKRHPSSEDAVVLWKTYNHRVNPLLKITFDWQLAELRTATIDPIDRDLTYPEHALLFAIYFTSIRSLSDEECTRDLNQPRSTLLLHYQQLCEQAFINSQFFTSSDLTVLQAVTLYICAGFGVMSSKSLQTLIALVVRNGERIGLHRDGSILGLSPYETEQRRRIWWQIQQLDLGLSVGSGSTSMTLAAGWDTAIPLNIEDKDLNLDAQVAPKERKGLTSMSYCLSMYWVMQEMRSLCIENFGKFSLSWPSERTWSTDHKRSIIERLEDGVNERYLKYCDPIRPIDAFMQLTARMTICTLKRFMLHPLAQNGTVKDISPEHRREILDLSVSCLGYEIAMNSTSALQSFRWRLIGTFPWSALIYVLIEAHQECTSSAAEELWALISDVYTANASLFNFADDHRKQYAAKLLLAAWEARDRALMKATITSSSRPYPKPQFLRELESTLLAVGANTSAQGRHGHTNRAERKQHEACSEANESEKRAYDFGSPSQTPQAPSKSSASRLDDDDLALFNPDEIDWHFWDAQLEDLSA